LFANFAGGFLTGFAGYVVKASSPPNASAGRLSRLYEPLGMGLSSSSLGISPACYLEEIGRSSILTGAAFGKGLSSSRTGFSSYYDDSTFF
jgi:hypothetical protein